MSKHRRRLKERGIARFEVRVHKQDVPLLRGVVDALADPERVIETRALLRERFPVRKTKGLKALLASAPLEGIELDRMSDTGRPVDL